jgi:hypothetical protein
MATIRVKWLKNHGAMIYSRLRGTGARNSRFVRPNGFVSILEAAEMLGTYDMKLYRYIRQRLIRSELRRGVRMIRLAEVRRVREAKLLELDRRALRGVA